jgi:phosphate transport system substrate-binding protein
MRKTSLTLAVMLMGCASAAMAQLINAAGATFPSPIYTKWFGEYHTAHSDVTINYGGGGSGAGIKQLTEGTVDFGASDMPMKDDQIAAMKIKPLHFPTVAGACVLTYNVPGVSGELKLSPEAVVGIFMGTVKKWNDKLITKDNPGVKLPGDDIIPVHRSDTSGTTFMFTDYLSKVSPEWQSKVGKDVKVSWPAEGLNGNGSNGVAGMVKQTPGSIGYVELTYASQNKMGVATLLNSSKEWVKPSLASVTAAVAGAVAIMPADFRVSITNAPGKGAYPISSLTWMLIPSQISDAKKAAALKGFLKWMLADGQKEAASLDFAPLPKEIVAKEVKQIDQINAGEQPMSAKSKTKAN